MGLAEPYTTEPVDGVPIRASSSGSHHIFTPPTDFTSPTKRESIAPHTNGSRLSPSEIPKRESVPSASDVPPQASPGQPATHLSSLNAIPHASLQSWGACAGRNGPSTGSSDGDKSYLDMYTLKQAQLEAAEKAHKEMMVEIMKARTNAEQLADRLQNELREETKSTRRLEETMRGKLEEQLRQEREIWNAERDLLLQKIRYKEQETEGLTMRNEQLKNRLRTYEMKTGFANDSLSPYNEEDNRLRSPSGRSFSPSGRSFSPSGRSFSPSGRSFSPSGRQTHPAERNISPSGGRYGSADLYSYYGPRRMTPHTLKEEEMPYEPPSSTIPPMSPPPPEYRKHAGHTPGASISLRSPPDPEETSPGAETPTQANFASLTGIANAGVPDAEPSSEKALRGLEPSEDDDEDPPLKGALGLKNNPEDSTLFLEMLDKKLENVSKDPAHNQPQVFNRGEDELSVISGSLDGKTEDGGEQAIAPHAADGNGHGAHHSKGEKEDDEKDEDEPIPLRLKSSMNFGAPLGRSLGRRSHEATLDDEQGL